MSRKRTRSSKISTENLIVIQDEKVKEMLDSIFKNQPIMSEKSFNLESNDKMVVPLPIRKTIDALNWNYFCDARSLPDEGFMSISHSSTISMERTLLLYAIMTERSINVGKIILKEIHDCAKNKTGSAYFPSLITSLYLKAHVKTNTNYKGPYVQGCITTYVIEMLVKNVHELNPPEPSELTESETDESSNEFEKEVDSVDETEEAKFKEEPNNSKSIKEPKVFEPREELNADEPVEPSVDLELTIPRPTYSNTVKKSELSIMSNAINFIALTIWTLWQARNKYVMEGKQETVRDISSRIFSLANEMKELNQKLPAPRDTMLQRWQPP
ncbi:hypothetical protein Gogos_015378 [Gossypium gossypioides]|uniref:Putative plant transposon protein domain-containing protein n=1 Tax=Gossypium gossypioides TaxID=34282 RepID=A0A7J9C1G6_GOSGO|nr:hypothetical protein [Gossypium gossypioides]